jgi:hypothetical protein
MMMMKRLPLALAIFATSAASTRAAVIVSGHVTTPGAVCTLTFTTDYSFQLNKPILPGTAAICIVFQDWVPAADGESDFTPVTPGVSVKIDGVASTYGGDFDDNLVGVIDRITARDGYLFIGGITASAGSIITIPAASYTFAGASTMNPAIAKTFNGNLLIVDGNGHLVGFAVPEPSSALLGCLGALSLCRRRR